MKVSMILLHKFKAEDKAIKEFIKKNKRKIDKIKDED